MEFSLSHIDEKKILAALHFTGLFDVFVFPVPFLSPPFFLADQSMCVCVCLGLYVCVYVLERERERCFRAGCVGQIVAGINIHFTAGLPRLDGPERSVSVCSEERRGLWPQRHPIIVLLWSAGGCANYQMCRVNPSAPAPPLSCASKFATSGGSILGLECSFPLMWVLGGASCPKSHVTTLWNTAWLCR